MADPKIDPQTMRQADAAPPPGIDPEILKSLDDPNNRVLGSAGTQQTNQGGWGDPNKTFAENVLDRGRQALRAVDTLGGRLPGTPSGSLVDPQQLIPASVGAGAATTAAGLMGPMGVGVGPALLRIAGAGAAGYGGEALAGSGDPKVAALSGAAGQVLGEAGGATANKVMAHRFATQLELTDSIKIPAAIRSEVSAFNVKSPNDVQALGVTGGKKLSAWYQLGTDGLIKQSGDPTIKAPALAELKASLSPSKQMSDSDLVRQKLGLRPGESAPYLGGNQDPSQMKLSEALKFIQSSGEAVHAGQRTPESVQLRQLWRQAQGEIGAALPPPLRAQYDTMRSEYQTGLALIDAIKSRTDIFTRTGNKVTFTSKPDATGGTPLQRAIYDSFGDAGGATNAAVHRGGAPGTGDAVTNNFLQNLWLRAHGMGVMPGASMHGGIPGTPQFAGQRQPAQVPPEASTLLGQRAAQAAGGLINLSPSQ